MCYHRRSVFSQRTDNDDDHEAAESEVNIFGQGERESGGLVKEPGGVKYALVECKFKNQSEGDKEDEVAQNEIKGIYFWWRRIVLDLWWNAILSV